MSCLTARVTPQSIKIIWIIEYFITNQAIFNCRHKSPVKSFLILSPFGVDFEKSRKIEHYDLGHIPDENFSR